MNMSVSEISYFKLSSQHFELMGTSEILNAASGHSIKWSIWGMPSLPKRQTISHNAL